jgi:cell division protein FtsB
MRWVSLILIFLILMWQYSLWLGKGSWIKVWELDRQVDAQIKINQQTKVRNAVLDAEVHDLKQGSDAIEERARSELGMIKPGEEFFQVVGESAALAVSSASTETHK